MSRRTASLVVIILLACTALATAAPLPARKSPAISADNAAQVRKLAEHPRDVWDIVWGPKPRQLSLLSWEKPVEVVDADTFKADRKIGGQRRLIHFAVGPDKETIAWCENTARVEIRNLRTEKAVDIETGNQQPNMAFSPDGKLLATGGYGTQAKLWDAASGRHVRSLDAGDEGGLAVAFSPDGKTLAVGNRNSVTHLYEVATGKLLHVLSEKMSHELKFSPDGSILAVAYVDGRVILWDVAGGMSVHARATGAKEVYTLDWSAKGDVLATAGLEGKITLWDSRDLSVLKELDAPEWVIRVRFSPDGSRLLSAGGTAQPSPDRKVTVWAVTPDRAK
jgi:WD40 repeat protein